MKQEILDAIKKTEVDDALLKAVHQEIDFMEKTDGLDDKPLINKFYDLWKKNGNTKKGHKNEINSWTAYLLGMTTKKPDPDKLFLPARRVFARAGYPDIDSDFDYERRSEIYDYIIQKYGEDKVSNIGTYNALKMKSYIIRSYKALDPDNYFGSCENTAEMKKTANLKTREIIDSLPRQFGAQLKVKDDSGKEHVIKTVPDAYKYCEDFKWYIDKYPGILRHSPDIEGLFSISGVHAAGIIISSVPLDEIAPLRLTKIRKEDDEEDSSEESYGYATQFPSEDLEQLGLIKIDVLALSTLSVIKHCVKMVKDNYNLSIDIENLSLEDTNTYNLYRSGKLVGVFQCEEHGMQEVMKQIQPTCFYDIMAGISLYRPGPMDSIPEYCARKLGQRPVNYFHKSIEPYVKEYLDKTYGLLVFQEQIMQICNSLAGFSITDGYQIIKAIGKKKESLLKKYKNQFVSGCVIKNIDKDLAISYWDKFITPFALYGFNAAHSAAYGYMSYITAYLKANFPDEFMTSFLNVEINRAKYKKIAKLENEVKKMGIEILPKRINNCSLEYTIISKKDAKNGIMKTQIRPSILCKGLSRDAAANIVENAPYKDIEDLARRTNPSVVDKSSIESMVEAGFFDGKKLEEFITVRKDVKKAKNKGLQSVDLFE